MDQTERYEFNSTRTQAHARSPHNIRHLDGLPLLALIVSTLTAVRVEEELRRAQKLYVNYSKGISEENTNFR